MVGIVLKLYFPACRIEIGATEIDEKSKIRNKESESRSKLLITNVASRRRVELCSGSSDRNATNA